MKNIYGNSFETHLKRAFFYFQLVFRMTSSNDGFSTTCESEKFGKMMWEGKFLQGGAQFVSILQLFYIIYFQTNISKDFVLIYLDR